MSDIGLCQMMLLRTSLFCTTARRHGLQWSKLHLSHQSVYLSGALLICQTGFSLSHIPLIIRLSKSGALSTLHSPTALAYPHLAYRMDDSSSCFIHCILMMFASTQQTRTTGYNTIPSVRLLCQHHPQWCILFAHPTHWKLLQQAKVSAILLLVESHTFGYIPPWSVQNLHPSMDSKRTIEYRNRTRMPYLARHHSLRTLYQSLIYLHIPPMLIKAFTSQSATLCTFLHYAQQQTLTTIA